VAHKIASVDAESKASFLCPTEHRDSFDGRHPKSEGGIAEIVSEKKYNPIIVNAP